MKFCVVGLLYFCSFLAWASPFPTLLPPQVPPSAETYFLQLKEADVPRSSRGAKIREIKAAACSLLTKGSEGMVRIYSETNQGSTRHLPFLRTLAEFEGATSLLPLPINGSADRISLHDGGSLVYISHTHVPMMSIDGHLGDIQIYDSDHSLLDTYHRTTRPLELYERGFRPGKGEFVRFFNPNDLHDGLVLDANCGAGGLVFDLAKEGVNIHGADLYISPLLKKLPRLFSQSDIRHFNPTTRYTNILTFFGPLSFDGHLGPSHEHLDEFLQAFNRLLVRGGRVRIFPASRYLNREAAERNGFSFYRFPPPDSFWTDQGSPILLVKK